MPNVEVKIQSMSVTVAAAAMMAVSAVALLTTLGLTTVVQLYQPPIRQLRCLLHPSRFFGAEMLTLTVRLT